MFMVADLLQERRLNRFNIPIILKPEYGGHQVVVGFIGSDCDWSFRHLKVVEHWCMLRTSFKWIFIVVLRIPSVLN